MQMQSGRGKRRHGRACTITVMLAVSLCCTVSCDDETPGAGDDGTAAAATTSGTAGTQAPAPVDELPDIPGLPRPIVPATPEPLSGDLAGYYQLISLGRTGAARVRLNNYTKAHPEDGKARFLFGLTYHTEKRYEKARTHFDQAIAIEPGYPLTYYFKAWALFYLGELDEAREMFLVHHAFQPDEADTIFGLGLIDLEANRLAEAESRFRDAIGRWEAQEDRGRELAKAYARLGDTLAKRDDLAEARAALEKAVALHEMHYEAWWMLYRVLVRLGEHDAAEEARRKHDLAKAQVSPRTSFPE